MLRKIDKVSLIHKPIGHWADYINKNTYSKEAEEEKIPYMVIVGEKEMKSGKLSLRKHGKGMVGEFEIEKLKEIFKKEMEE